MSKIRDKYVAAGKIVESGKIDFSRSGVPPAPRMEIKPGSVKATPVASRKKGSWPRKVLLFALVVFGLAVWHYREAIGLFDALAVDSEQSSEATGADGANVDLNTSRSEPGLAASLSADKMPDQVVASGAVQSDQSGPTATAFQSIQGSDRSSRGGEQSHAGASVRAIGAADSASSGQGNASSLQAASEASLGSKGGAHTVEPTGPVSPDVTAAVSEPVSSAQLVTRFIAEEQGPTGCGDFPEVYCESDVWNQAARYALQVGSACDVGTPRGETCPIDAESVINRKVHEIEILALQRKQVVLERQLSGVRFSAPSSYSLEIEPCKNEAIRLGLRGEAYEQYVASTCMPAAQAARVKPLRELLDRVVAKIAQLSASKDAPIN